MIPDSAELNFHAGILVTCYHRKKVEEEREGTLIGRTDEHSCVDFYEIFLDYLFIPIVLFALLTNGTKEKEKSPRQ